MNLPDRKGSWVARFSAMVDERDDGCWIWIGAKASSGHGLFHVGGSNRQAGQLMWWLHHGEQPPDYMKRTCGRADCVNPGHVDAEAGRTHLTSEHHPRRKAVVGPDGTVWPSIKDAAEAYGVERSTVRTWIRRGDDGWVYAESTKQQEKNDDRL